jgi:prevent-host-death family protein
MGSTEWAPGSVWTSNFKKAIRGRPNGGNAARLPRYRPSAPLRADKSDGSERGRADTCGATASTRAWIHHTFLNGPRRRPTRSPTPAASPGPSPCERRLLDAASRPRRGRRRGRTSAVGRHADVAMSVCATMSHMERVGVRELRRQASAILRRVAAGETVEVTDRGRPVAILIKTMPSGLARLEREGLLRRAEADLLDLRPVPLPADAAAPSQIVANGRSD